MRDPFDSNCQQLRHKGCNASDAESDLIFDARQLHLTRSTRADCAVRRIFGWTILFLSYQELLPMTLVRVIGATVT